MSYMVVFARGEKQLRLFNCVLDYLNFSSSPSHAQTLTLFLPQTFWEGQPPPNGVMAIDECQEFHRLWSAIQFAYCMPLSAGQLTVE